MSAGEELQFSAGSAEWTAVCPCVQTEESLGECVQVERERGREGEDLVVSTERR